MIDLTEFIEEMNTINMDKLKYPYIVEIYNKLHTLKLEEQRNVYIYLFPVPGLTKEDIKINLLDRHFEIEVTKTNKFIIDSVRKIKYPGEVYLDKGVLANVKDGLLTIEFKKKVYQEVIID